MSKAPLEELIKAVDKFANAPDEPTAEKLAIALHQLRIDFFKSGPDQGAPPPIGNRHTFMLGRLLTTASDAANQLLQAERAAEVALLMGERKNHETH